MHELERAAARALAQQTHPGQRVIAAVSGGADSMALLACLLNLQELFELQVEAVHVNHGLRPAALQEQQLVEAFCAGRGVRLHCFSHPPQAERRSEDWARQLRYSYFDQLLEQRPGVIATAHTLSDQAETLLFRLARGTGPRGAVGIPAQRPGYIRPLLEVERACTEDYCRTNGILFAVDESNLDQRYARNRIRHQVIPQLEQINPKAQQALGDFCTRLAQWQQYFAQEGANLLQKAKTPHGWERCILAQAPQPVLQEALAQLVAGKRTLRQTDLEPLNRLCAGEISAVELGPGLRLELRKGQICWADLAVCSPAAPAPAHPGVYHLPGGYTLELTLLEGQQAQQMKKIAQTSKKGLNNALDYDKISDALSVRTRQPGDVFRPAGRGGSKTLKKLFNEKAVPAAQRSLLPLLAQGSQVVWLWGEGAAEDMRPGPHTQRILTICPRAKELET